MITTKVLSGMKLLNYSSVPNFNSGLVKLVLKLDMDK